MNPRYPLSIYIHIPFCRKKCGYCDFYSVSNGKNYYRDVLNGILRQLRIFLDKNNYLEIHTVYIGGGTPSSLPDSILDSFLTELKKIIPDTGKEFTIEINPEDVTDHLLDIFKRHGIDRISMGIQSLNIRLLEILGRNAAKESSLKAMETISGNWQGKINFDIITSIPGQTVDNTLNDLETVLSYSPDHISLYTLTYEDNTPITGRIESGIISRVPEETESLIFNESINFLEKSGYGRYEISNFAKPGAQSVHNMAYWTMNPYFGAGPSAVSTIPGKSGPVRLENSRDLTNFTNIISEDITAPSFLLEHLLMGFRLVEGICVDRIENIFSIDFFKYFSNALGKWENNLQFKEGKISLDRNGLQLLNRFLLDMSSEISDNLEGLCRWPLL